ncbi:hypothetical protein EMIHUDRAFT_211294 [Emiliania huxleyi CCMP1516]|uniref:Uncharacterized protein n=2 Tax=Emiliania huxleyi TaxID=2903 RepID=A0A0D3IWR6_EMIH1|nr:hypothetical protein EMIHUDRAFT_211294 [Emiliania huxleyi CCMP1516]EOD15701.1 hypothetical protein EMIHUDRAFT_211294 [Emiliania huxleyi CCMP1516]|eukprot:XP_005768130.1 hypothetical protein EMIHUDRAFT_211294 [Emiliania huxleyi CCMP1516]
MSWHQLKACTAQITWFLHGISDFAQNTPPGSGYTNPRYPTRPKDIHLENLENLENPTRPKDIHLENLEKAVNQKVPPLLRLALKKAEAQCCVCVSNQAHITSISP